MPAVLTITRTFPPVGPPGSSIRLVKLIKYLSRAGWQFHIITQDPDRPSVHEKGTSSVLLEEIPEGVQVHRRPALFSLSDQVPLNSALRYLTALDWGLGVVASGLREIRRRKIDLIYAGIPNFVNGVTCALLARITKIPLVLDIKDDVVGGMVYLSKSKLRQWFERYIEKFIFTIANKCTFATLESLEVYKHRYPDLSSNFFFVPNGCDLDEFFNLGSVDSQKSDDCFLILSAASRYRPDYRDAEPLIRALADFVMKQPEARGNTRVVFLGNSLGDEYIRLIDQLGITGMVENLPFAGRAAYRAWLASADLLFLVQPYKNSTSTAGTLYEYWANGKAPILLFAEKGSSQDLVESHSLGKVFHFCEVKQAASYIQEIYLANRAGSPKRISSDGVEAFDRKEIAKQMDSIWKSCLDGQKLSGD